MTKRRYKSDLLAVVHKTALDLERAGGLKTCSMKEFDDLCLASATGLGPEDIRAIREREGVGREVFARHLWVTPRLVGRWESGESRPRGASLKLLTLVANKGLDAIA